MHPHLDSAPRRPYPAVALALLVALSVVPSAAAVPDGSLPGGLAVHLLDAPETPDPDDFWALRAEDDDRFAGGHEGRREVCREVWLARFSGDLDPVEERRQPLGAARPWPDSAVIDARGRLWLVVFVPRPPAVMDDRVLRVYSPAGELVAESALPGTFLGLERPGSDTALVLVHDGDGPRIVRLDPRSGDVEVLLRFSAEEFGGMGGDCLAVPRSLQPADGGAVYWIHDYGHPDGFSVVRRYEASGAPSASWRLPADGGGGFMHHRAAGDGDSVLVAMNRRVVRLDPSGARSTWTLPRRPRGMLARDGGVLVLLGDGRSVVRLDAHGVGPRRPLDLPPAGLGYAEWRRRLDRLSRVDPDRATTDELLDLLLSLSGEPAERAHRALVAAGADTVPALLAADPDLLARLPPGAADRWLGEERVDRLTLAVPPAR